MVRIHTKLALTSLAFLVATAVSVAIRAPTWLVVLCAWISGFEAAFAAMNYARHKEFGDAARKTAWLRGR